MDTTLRVMVVGKICGGSILWNPPLPDDVDIAFDAPSTCSYFAHLMPVDGELQKLIDEGEAASTRFGNMLLAMIGDDDSIDYDAELLELQDGMADDEFNRWGGA